jgi:hypothetical protein
MPFPCEGGSARLPIKCGVPIRSSTCQINLPLHLRRVTVNQGNLVPEDLKLRMIQAPLNRLPNRIFRFHNRLSRRSAEVKAGP